MYFCCYLYVFLMLRLNIIIVMPVLCILFHCVIVCIVFVHMFTVLLSPGVNLIAVNKYVSYIMCYYFHHGTGMLKWRWFWLVLKWSPFRLLDGICAFLIFLWIFQSHCADTEAFNLNRARLLLHTFQFVLYSSSGEYVLKRFILTYGLYC